MYVCVYKVSSSEAEGEAPRSKKAPRAPRSLQRSRCSCVYLLSVSLSPAATRESKVSASSHSCCPVSETLYPPSSQKKKKKVPLVPLPRAPRAIRLGIKKDPKRTRISNAPTWIYPVLKPRKLGQTGSGLRCRFGCRSGASRGKKGGRGLARRTPRSRSRIISPGTA